MTQIPKGLRVCACSVMMKKRPVERKKWLGARSGCTLLTTRDLGWEREGQEFKANFHYIKVLRLAWVTKDAASNK